jgi:aspartate racemase
MVELSERVRALTPEQAALLERRLRERAAQRARDESLPRRAERGTFPLSFAQQRLWFVDRYNQGSPFYNFPLGYRVRGALDAAALLASLAEIVRRHEALRTVFVLDGERPLQVVQPARDWSAEVIDLQPVPDPAAREREAERIAREAAREVFDLARGPLFRVLLLRFAADDHRLQIVVHHIVFDGWSIAVLVRELEALYDAFSAVRPATLPELPIQYGDFAVWQRARLRGEALRDHLEFWRRQLAGLTSLELPADRPRPPLQGFRGAVRPFAVPAAASRSLAAWSRDQGVTLFMTFLATFATLLERRSGQSDIAVATPVANRTRPEIEGLIGCFVNTLVVRTDLAGDPSFRELVARVRGTALAAQAHQDLPFEKLVEELQPERDASRNPLVQVSFVLQQGSVVAAPRLPGLETTHLSYGLLETTRFDLELHVWETGGGLEGLVVYNTDLFDAATAARLALHFQELLAAVAARPDERLSRLPVLTAAERHQLLDEWNDTATDFPRHLPIHRLFEERVRRSPEAVALVCGGEPLSYRALNARANRLARRLVRLGVGPDALVGVALERSPTLIVTLLAVLKAGGAFVPLDVTYPEKRLAGMVEDLAIQVLVTESALAGRLPAAGARQVCLDLETPALAAEPDDDLPVDVPAASLAYVMFTSGSTGRPKGIGVAHRAVVRLVRGTSFARFAGETFLQFAPVSFDASTFEIWGALLNGARLVIAPPGALSLAELGCILRRDGVTTLWLTAGLFHLMVDERLEDLGEVRQLLAGGDVLSVPHVRRVLAALPGTQLVNGYGPTEGTTFTCCHRLAPADGALASIPIGRPIANSEALLLDRNGQPVPIGVPGELLIGGEGLARGYLRRPDLTAERFVPHPFAVGLGARLYRSGDLARWRPDGTIEFLGRLDQQVKIRGFRIELGEIEAELAAHPAVRDAVVVAWREEGGNKRLVAYVVADPLPTAESLHAHLRARLPDYMLPSVIVFLETLPLGATGKVDRQALPAPEAVRSDGCGSYLPPRDAVELLCAHVWEEALGVRPIGVRDDFFALGGHSLLAIGILARIKKVFGRDLAVSILFQRPTIERLAAALRTDSGAVPFSPLVPVQPHGTRPLFFCVHPAGGNVLCYLGFARHLGSDQPFYGLQARALEEDAVTFRSVEEIAADYLAAVREAQPAGPYFFGGYCLGGAIAFEMARQARDAGEQVALLVLMDTFAPAALAEEEFDDALALSWFGRDLGMPAGKRLSVPAEELRGLPAEEAFGRVLAKAKEEEVLPQEAEAAQLSRYFHCYLANSVALLAYEPRTYAGRVVLLRARDEEDKHHLGPTRGWDAFTAGEIAVEEVPGDHATMVFEPNLKVLAERLRAAIDAARQALAAGDVGAQPGGGTATAEAAPDDLPRILPTFAEEAHMIHLQHSYTVERPIEEAFAFLADPRMELQWNTWMREVRLPPGGDLGEGSTFQAVLRSMGRTVEITARVERYLPPREVTFRVVEGPFVSRMAYTLQPAGGDMTRVDVDFQADPKDFFGIIPKPLLRPIFRKSMKDDCRRQKTLMEAQAAPASPRAAAL